MRRNQVLPGYPLSSAGAYACIYMCIHLWDCVHSSSGCWQDHFICCIHFTGNWWLSGISHWLLWVILYNSLYCIDLNHKSLHKSWLFRIYDWTCYVLQSVHCHTVNILICVRGLTVRSGACLQLSLCFALSVSWYDWNSYRKLLLSHVSMKHCCIPFQHGDNSQNKPYSIPDALILHIHLVPYTNTVLETNKTVYCLSEFPWIWMQS